MSSIRPVRPRCFLLASAALTSFAALDLPAAVAQQAREPLPPVEVSPAQSRKQARPAGREGQTARRAQSRRSAAATTAAPKPAAASAGVQTPLNTNVVAESASRLGLTVRQIPATVEVISAETMREQGYRTVSEVAQGAVGVTSGDNPAEPAAFSMRGFTNSQINMLYNGIKIGPQNMTSRITDTANLQAVEFLKGPASLISGEGAAGGSINLVTKQPHTGAIRNEADFSWDSLNSFGVHYGSGGSTNLQGLDYRFDISRASLNGFADDTNTKTLDVSGQLNYRISDSLKIWGAIEYREDRSKAYWGTPLVPIAFSGSHATSGIVSGNYFNRTDLGAVTIDDRTFNTNYNVLDNRNVAQEVWLRGGFELKLAPDLTLKSQAYGYGAERTWFNNEIEAFDSVKNQVYRERFYVAHSQRLLGNITDLIWDANIAGFDNRMATTFSSSYLDFVRPGAANFPNDFVSLVDPDRGFYGDLTTKQQTARIDNEALSFEDRLKLTRTFALIGGLRVEHIGLDRNSTDQNGLANANFPFTKDWAPVTGRIGYTWDAVPGLTFFSQYATGADISANNIFLLAPTQNLDLTTARTYETGVKHLFWDNRAEWSFSAYDIVRKNVYAAAGGQTLNIAGRQESKGVELAAAVRPIDPLRVWGNIAYVDARYADYNFAGGSFSGNTPPNVPRVVANAGASYRFFTPWPVELGITGRYVGDRYNTDANVVTMKAYTVADVYAFVDIPRTVFNAVDQARLTFRVRNITDKRYAIWGDPFYPDQILLGAPRTYELSAAFKW
ncbi:TonB-dependent receptor [Bradyrhizobium japonicum]|uniref:TonB-dependent receptor n=1 Tax=Bradyrhizobium japonicum TaxID=375 RepID=UPI00057DCEE5|nr:TonB-dependent receptor [Bradyrhizobium japonicum]MCD9105812.1 TonB-dependent receptor [Bradyrhizobium japonicum]MCD9253372.1 TonB-dependent receptor [Bradyrhizobium japonicum SEMIA 5079]MCD9818457.1 TonB-dependent receptor [Bradyrhizobium japonicum]MCD9891438.1 TonB-dependent receptor [Bradyrhizobium japonicum]MCD9907305.1 TonB-dependent receptor [Bradyrhizobium japonicum]